MLIQLRSTYACVHLLLQRNCVGSSDPSDALSFEVEERTQCVTSGKVRYTRRSEVVLALPMPLTAATNTRMSTFTSAPYFQFGHRLAGVSASLVQKEGLWVRFLARLDSD